MSNPANPPSNPTGPPTEPAGTPIPEAASIPPPAQPDPPAQPLSLTKAPADLPAPAAEPGPADAPAPAPEPESAEAAVPTPEPGPTDGLAPAAEPGPTEVPAPAPEPGPGPADAAVPAPRPEPDAAVPVAGPADAPPSASAPAPTPASAFAPPSPSAPSPTAPGAPANPWGTPAGPGPGYGGGVGYGPGYGGGAGYPGYAAAYPQPAEPVNGLAVAALVLGIISTFLSVIPFIFWGGTLLALIAIGIGIGAVSRAKSLPGSPRRTMAIIGAALGGLALIGSIGGFFTTKSILTEIDRQTANEIDELDDVDGLDVYPYPPGYSDPTPKAPTPKASPSDIPGRTSALAWGKTFTYPNGVEVTAERAVPYSPGKSTYPRDHSGHAVKVTVKIVNKSDAALDVHLALPHARDDQGGSADMLFDTPLPKMFKGSVMPGESATGVFLFSVPEGTKGLHFELSPGLPPEYPQTIWSGPIG
ncbi:DUF4352 domain-containing protein [Streptomyces sp. APSN-46.1]|uniref:DUF4190 domain-containing protein n=1 Tax=Streptomyces sp. APSN-46.1 TaxID=2929049 RepID=UPI001FB475BD|nr:DUF4190 domain-containing protein [Streptomyces sp. APSN-46.1]MCJ1677620.1 DUF4352 domain-containing protein [Streptomyces sp. APSN-46.1]